MDRYVTKRQRRELKRKKRKRIAIAILLTVVLCIAGSVVVPFAIKRFRTRLSGSSSYGSFSTVESDPISIPDYSGNDYDVLNNGKPNFNAWDLENITGEHYIDLDSLGRCGTPYFKGKKLLARGVEMEAYSVEDHGDGVCFHVFVYNVQPGIELDYTTGKSKRK